MLKITSSFFSFRLVNVALIALLSASPILTNDASNSTSSTTTDNRPTATSSQSPVLPGVSQPQSTSNIQTGQPDTQEKNSILSLKTGKNLLKVVGIGTNLLIILVADPVNNLADYFISGGTFGTIVALAESIVKDYKSPRQEGNTIHHAKITHAVFALCKSIGLIGHGLFWNELRHKKPLLALGVVLSNFLFLGHSLYGDYEAHVANKNSGENTSSTSPNDSSTPAPVETHQPCPQGT